MASLQKIINWERLSMCLVSRQVFAGVIALLFIPSVVWAASVTVKPLSEVVVFPQYSAPASVISLHDSQLSAEVSGVITDIVVQVGEHVTKGDVLMRLESFDYQQALAQAESTLTSLQARIDLAEYQLQQAQRLSQQKNVSEELLLQRQTELKSLRADQQRQQAALTQAKRNLQRTEIRAPFSGVVTARQGQLGGMARMGDPLLRLVASESLEVSAFLQVAQAGELVQAKELALQINGDYYPLQLRTITPVVDAKARTREARLIFVDKLAMAGSSGRLQWQETRPHLPADLVLTRDGQLGVFLVEKGKAVFHVLAHDEPGRPVRVEDINRDALVIIDGRFRLQHGETLDVK
jgi:RND family efflux transporter MFP subunit